MTAESMMREVEAALVLLRRIDSPASIHLRLSRDRGGVERLTVERVEGIPLSLLTNALDLNGS